LAGANRWYISVDGEDLEQGDIFYDFPVVIPHISAEDMRELREGRELTSPSTVMTMNVVLMTQSCDLAREQIESVILCPIWDVNDRQLNFNRSTKEQIRKGHRPAWHLLKNDEVLGIPLTVVEFSRLFVASKEALRQASQQVQSRPRLLSPYKEHLSQAFARFFMRVGLPSGIPAF
jgi:hypothetical protein